MSVGEFGIHTRVAISSKKASATVSTAPADAPYRSLGAATVRATRQNRSSGPSDRKSTRLNSSHSQISYAVFCLKKKKKQKNTLTSNYTPKRRSATQPT